MALTAGALTLLTASGAPALAAGDPIAIGFANVPPESRLRMFWRIFGPAWTREGIDEQLEALQRAGVGGVMTCFTYPVELDDPARGIRNQQFLSPEFLETFRYAAEKARQLDLQFGVCGGTGWPFGGPSVTLDEAAQSLRAEMLQPLAEGSGYALPKLRQGQRYLAAFVGTRDVTPFIHDDRLGVDLAPAAAGPARVFIAGPTSMKVKRPSLGAEGYVVDHFRRDAAKRYLDAVAAPMLRAAPDGLLRSLFCDSLEVYHANWTHDFPAQFQRRRGYDLIPHLPELFDDAAPTTPDLRYDFWRTTAELAEERFARTVHQWCRKNRVTFALEPYGTPSMSLAGARYCDVPWGEQYEWKGFSFSRFAASAGHLAGKKIIGAEAWTWTGIPNRLADSLSDLKLCSDLHFLSGENELTGVDFPYSPRSAGVPGWMPYYGPVMGLNNPQWLCFPELAAYVNRCQWLLRQGRPVADVALYTPTEDVFAHGPTDQMLLDFQLRDRLASGTLTDEFGLDKAFRHHSEVVYSLLTHGYNFDGIDCFAVNALARVQGRQLVAGDGRYSLLVLPNLEGIDLPALEKIAAFCRAGGTVIATRRLPDRVYGLQQGGATQRLRGLIEEMFGPTPPGALSSRDYGHGRVIFTPDEREGFAAALAHASVGPDMRVSTSQSEVSHVHRRLRGRDFYFVANIGASEARFTADFRVHRQAASLWNPMNGAITPLPILTQDHNRTQVSLTLPPRGSVFVCLSNESRVESEASRTAGTVTPSPPHSSTHFVGTRAPRVPAPSSAHPLEIPWRVSFDGPDAPPPYQTRALTSWTGWPGARYFSGRATYSGTFAWPPTAHSPLPRPAARPLAVVPPCPHCLLRFDQVREVAEIIVNGHRAGAVWTPPFELEIGRYLKPGENTLRIIVANLPVNRVLGLPDPDLAPLRAVYGERFPDPQEKKLMPAPAPSGLIGRVVLVTEVP